MSVRVVELCRLELVLLNALRTSVGEHGRRPVLLVRVVTDDGEGYGECSALAEPTYTEEYADGAEAVLAAHLIPRLLAVRDPAATLDDLLATSDSVRGHPMAKAALEMALLDAALRAEERSLASYLGATRSTVPAGANIGIDTPSAVVHAVGRTLDAGYRRVKCKIAPGHDLDLLRAVRAAYPDLVLSADANGSYDLADPDHLAALHAMDSLGLVALEQPLRPDDLVGHARLCTQLDTPVLLDESVTGLGSLEAALALGAADGVSVKPARVGGVLAARAIHDRCVDAGVHLAIGGMLETGIGRAAALAVAALPGFDLPGDLGGSERYFSPDVTMPHELRDGELEVPTGPGIGVEPLPGVVSSARVRNRVFRAS